ncbi:methyltransferase domain-containing protein [Candidatus Bathyarchaeota archaeon]|nr:methyltransferase domain-containing protein [Candidatus Bathyarchaeota archaeon]
MKTLKADYSKISTYYDRVRPISDFWVSQVIQIGQIEYNSRLLDVGCGTGRFSIPLQRRTNAIVYGADVSREMLKGGLEKEKDLYWIQGSAESIPFKNNYFDQILMAFAIHHVDKKEEVVREMYRVLKKGGKCIMVTSSHEQIEKALVHRYFPGLLEIDLARFPSLKEIEKFMHSAGFKNVYHKYVKDVDTISKEELLEKVRNRFISTLTLLSDKDFEKGLSIFQEKLENVKGEERSEHTFVIGEKLD